MRKKALVTGATGFVGSNLVRGLIHDGWQVDVIVRSSSDLMMIADIIKKLGVYEYEGEINSLIDMMSQSEPDVVFHVASLFLSDHRPDQVDSLVQSNVLFGVQLLEAMSKAGVQNIVNTSTSWEHYKNRNYSPVNLYAATKRAFQGVLQFYIEARGVKAITLKLFDTCGADDPRSKLLNLLMKTVESEESLEMSPGEQKISLVHVDDVVNAYIVAAQRLLEDKVSEHEIYSIANKNFISLKELVKLIEAEVNKKININWGRRCYRRREVMMPWNDGNPLPGWSIEWEVKDMLKMLCERNLESKK